MKKIYLLLAVFVVQFVFAQTTPTGNSTEVGITEGALSVSLTGGASYNITIAVPPGINGVVPQISLAYNSQGGNGMAGYGWNIAGVSAITRIPRTQFHDGAVGGVNLDANDRFALDGQRLILKSGTYGAPGATYETENFSNVNITSVAGYNNNPALFLVEYPDGSKAVYGGTTDSKSITTWGITYWENSQGVRISYNYTNTNNSIFIDSIKYGAVGTSAPINQINFVYDTRTRPEQAYVAGQSIVNTKILKQINVIGNSVGFRNYTLTYEPTSLNYQRLKSITETSGDGTKSYNPTVFSYETTTSEELLTARPTVNTNLYNINNASSATFQGDFDGDGKTDIVIYPVIGDNAMSSFNLFKNLNASTSNNAVTANVGPFKSIFASTWLTWNGKVAPFQGITTIKNSATAGFVDFNTYYYDSSTTFDIRLQYTKTINFPEWTKADGCTSSSYGTGCTTSFVAQSANPNAMKYFSGDFNGDGLTDVMAIETVNSYDSYCAYCYQGNSNCSNTGNCYTLPPVSTSSYKAYFVDLRRDLNTTTAVSASGSIGYFSKAEVADFNGDGKSDLMLFSIGSVSVYSMDSSNNLVLLAYYNEVGIKIADKPVLIGDYNGDGKMDFCIPQEINQDSWNFYFATGTSFVAKNSAIGFTYRTSSCDYINFYRETYFIASDFNSDGKADIIGMSNSTTLAPDPGILSSNREEFICQPYYSGTQPIRTEFIFCENILVNSSQVTFNPRAMPFDINYGLKRYPIISFFDHNNPNKKSEFSLIQDNKIITFKQPKDSSIDVMLKSITTGNGIKENITYKRLEKEACYYCTPVYSPTIYASNYPNTDINVASSFQVVSMLEKQSTSVYKKQLFSYAGATSNMQGLGFLGFRATMRTNWFDTDSQIISSISKFNPDLRGANTENYTYLGLRSAVTIATQTAITTGIPNAIIKKDYTQTGAETLTASGSILLQPGATGTLIKPTAGNVFMAKILPNYDATGFAETGTTPDSSLITKSLSNYEATLSATKVYKLQNVQSKSYNILDNTSSETNTVYDIYNNPTVSNTKLKNGGVDEQVTVATVNYEPITASPYTLGRPKSKIQTVMGSGDSMTSTETYGYGTGTEANLLKTIKKKGNNTNEILEENDYDAFGNITQKRIVASPLATRTTNYKYDTSGRFLTESFDIEGIKTTFEYNPNSTLKWEINPYLLKTSYEYDSWFKKTKTTDYLGKTNNYYYSGGFGIIKITTAGGDDNSWSEELFDELGRKIKTSVKDIQGNISYKDYLYDIYDRNFKVSEPYASSASQWNTTQYDVYGRPKTVTAFTGKVVSMVYDKLTTTVTDSSTGKTKASTKNAMGNVVRMVETPTGGTPQTINYSYFANGNLKETNYDGTKITITQDGWGRKTSLHDPSAGVYTYAYNALGESTQETTPIGTTTYILDPATGKLVSKTIKGTKTDSATTYAYDPTTKLMTGSIFTNILEANSTITNAIEYDGYKRVLKTTEITPFAKFEKAVTYDAWGRTNTETSKAELNGKTSTITTANTYKNGYAYEIRKDTPTGAILWATDEVNARGQLTKAKLGNGIGITNTYDPYGYVENMKHTLGTSPVMELGTVFDTQRGNLKSRTNSLFGTNDIFEYDSQDRLKNYPDALGNTVIQTYEEDGRIKANTLGTYNYTNTTKKYQNTSVTLSPEATGYYANREGIYSDSMEDKNGWNFGRAHNPQCVSYDDTKVHTNPGKTSLRINTTGQTVAYIHSVKNIAINNTTDTQYTISSRIYSEGPTAQLTLFMLKDGETGYFTNVESQSSIVTGQWTTITKNITVPANIRTLNLRLDNVGTGNVWFDDVQIRKTANPALIDPNYKDHKLDITYNTFKSPVDISEAGVDKISFTYNDGNDRSVMFYGSQDANKTDRTYRKHYSADGSMEIKENTKTGAIEFITYLGGDGYSAPVVYKQNHDATNPSGVGGLLYLHRDYQGSILAITNSTGQVLEKRLFDAWGAIVKVQDGAGNTLAGLTLLDRGYTGHEHIQSVGLIHMNGRLYDPKLHRFLQPDNYVQDPSNTQNYNRYAYVLNNPLMYTDPSGELFWIPIIIGAVIGAYSGGTLANNGQLNPFKWDYSSGKTWGYMLGGAIVGGISGGVANSIATSGVAFANTQALIAGSLINSVGTFMYTGGQTDLSVSFGVGSFNFSTGELGYLGKKGNSFMENLGYGLGAVANVSDALAGMKPGQVQLNTEHSDAIGHSALTKVGETDGLNSLVSVGPDVTGKGIFDPLNFQNKAVNWHNYVDVKGTWKKVVEGVNLKSLANYSKDLANGAKYNLYFSSCVNHTARALTVAGVPVLGLHPFILNAQIYLRNIGFRPSLFSYHLQK